MPLSKKTSAIIILLTLLCNLPGFAQEPISRDNFSSFNNSGESHWRDSSFDNDSTEKVGVPIGLSVWKIDRRFGDICQAQPDTIPHGFQNDAFTSGRNGEYNYLGNLGSPRMSRIFFDNGVGSNWDRQFIFSEPYSFFLTGPQNLLFSNTKSPITNITYHSCGNKQNGEDRIRGIFATNVNKRLGLGFKLDYLYGRGYYQSQSTAHFNGTLYGSYMGEKYQLHAMYYANHLKNAENGGIEDDSYVTAPESFPTTYGTADMPTRLSKTWNKMNVNTLFLTQRYNIGFTRYRDSKGRVVRHAGNELKGKFLNNAVTTRSDSLTSTSDSLRAIATKTPPAADSLRLTPEFVPVAGFVHTFRFDHNNRRFLSNITANETSPYYFDEYYLPGDSANDYTKNFYLENTLAFEVHEGFSNWVKSGLRLFARHEFNKFSLPEADRSIKNYTENYFTIGAQLFKRQGSTFHYDVIGEMRTNGTKWGQFNVEGSADFNFPLSSDTLKVRAFGFVRNEEPTFYYRHYHARNAWWDKSFDNVFSARAAGQLSYKNTKLTVGFQTIQNYAYFAESQSVVTGSDGNNSYLYSVAPLQTGKNIQVISATLNQDFHWGIFHWDNELTYQMTSEKDILPLPHFTGYSNLYILFRLARVLNTELGADVRYFTSYYAPAYSPIIGQFAVQDASQRIKIGNYPTINVYANFHLKHTRFYVMASHVNYSSGSGNPFLVPHYPLNRLVLRIGISWNFFN